MSDQMKSAPDTNGAIVTPSVSTTQQPTSLGKVARLATMLAMLGGMVATTGCDDKNDVAETPDTPMVDPVEPTEPTHQDDYESRLQASLAQAKQEGRRLTAMDTCMAWYGDQADPDKCELVVELDRTFSRQERAARVRATLDTDM